MTGGGGGNKNGKWKMENLQELSAGTEEDLVVVPNVPMLSATSQSKHAARFLRLAMASIMDILRIKPFVEVSIGQLLWGYEDPLFKLAKDVVPKEQKLPYDQFGLLYGKNGTMPDWFTVHTGQQDISKYGIMDKWNGKSKLGHWTTPECDSVAGSDGSIFPPPITKQTVLKVFDKDLCRALPLVFKVSQRHAFSPFSNARSKVKPARRAAIRRDISTICFAGRGNHRRWRSRLQVRPVQGRVRLSEQIGIAAMLLPGGSTLRSRGNLQRLPLPLRFSGVAQFSTFLPW